jgi:hypothetical protein
VYGVGSLIEGRGGVYVDVYEFGLGVIGVVCTEIGGVVCARTVYFGEFLRCGDSLRGRGGCMELGV